MQEVNDPQRIQRKDDLPKNVADKSVFKVGYRTNDGVHYPNHTCLPTHNEDRLLKKGRSYQEFIAWDN